MGPVDKVNSAMNWTTFTVWWKEKHYFIFGRYHAQLLWFSQFDLLYIFPPLQFDKRRWFDIFWPCIRMCSPSFPTQRVSILAQRSRPTLHCTLLSHPSQQLNKSKENLRLPGFLELPCWLVLLISISVTHFHLSYRRCVLPGTLRKLQFWKIQSGNIQFGNIKSVKIQFRKEKNSQKNCLTNSSAAVQ